MSRFEIKIVAALLLIAVIPLAASVVLVGQVIKVSDSVTEGQTQRLAQPLEKAAQAYRALFAARKRTFQLQAQLLALDAELLRVAGLPERAALERRLGELVETEGVGRLVVVDVRGERVATRTRRQPYAPERHRDLELELPLGSTGLRLRAVFFTPLEPFEDFRRLGAAHGASAAMTQLRDELALYYRTVFVIIFGAVAIVATGLGLFIARRTARRVTVLAQATRKVAAGDLETRVELRARDEIGDLAAAFNEMVRQIKESGERITYLEKIGAWQGIARRLAHEIKNPLTPIQLAVQQLHSRYPGDDPEFTRLLDEAREIITEEVGGLRRLVQAFSAFAKLPAVQPEPVDVNAVVDDFLKSHSELSQRARIAWTPLAPERSRLVPVDRMLIKHALFNLVENAIQAAEEAGTAARLAVSLSARIDEENDRAEICVSDDGPGMTAETAQRIFEPYFTTKERGTGLGLSIVKKIVLEHRGAIAFETREGRGTRFVITLPLAGTSAGRG